MNNGILNRLLVMLCALVWTADGSTQTLPTHHYRTADIVPSGDYAARVLFSKPAASFTRYTVGHDNIAQNTVTLLWEGAYFTNGVMDYNLRDLEWQIVSTSFRPLAVAAEGGMGSVLYVVGWHDRTSEVVVDSGLWASLLWGRP